MCYFCCLALIYLAGILIWLTMNECQDVTTQQQDEAIHNQTWQTSALVTTLGHTERGCGVKQAHRSIQQFSVPGVNPVSLLLMK